MLILGPKIMLYRTQPSLKFHNRTDINLIKINCLGKGNRPDGHHSGLSMSETYLYHETNQSYTEGPKLPIHSKDGTVCTAFTSKSHGYRPVVVYGAHGFTTLYLWDYTISNDWETCKSKLY